MPKETNEPTMDMECLSAKLVDHEENHKTDLSSHPAAPLSFSIFRKINNAETNESTVLSSLQTEFTDESLKTFIRKIWTLKNERNLPDDTAVSALSLLLPDVASQWWEDTRPFVHSWDLAVALILKVLNERRTLQDAWKEFQSCHQHDRHLISFLNEQRILLAEIRQPFDTLPRDLQIDMIYYKLNKEIRRRIERSKITSIDDLIKQAQQHNDLMECNSNLSPKTCSHCKRLGHDVTDCSEREYEVNREIREKERGRYHKDGNGHIPYIEVNVNGIPEYVHLATDSDLNIISDSLYAKLLSRKCVFESSKQTVSTTRSVKASALQIGTVIVECNQHLVATPVVKLSNTRGIKNCFGLGFIIACDLLNRF